MVFKPNFKFINSGSYILHCTPGAWYKVNHMIRITPHVKINYDFFKFRYATQLWEVYKRTGTNTVGQRRLLWLRRKCYEETSLFMEEIILEKPTN